MSKTANNPLTARQWVILIGIVCAIGFVWNTISPSQGDHCVTEYKTAYVYRGLPNDMGQDAYVAQCHANDKYIANNLH
jgi:hypothetical protein